MVTDQNGNVVSRRDFLPFGEEIFADGTIRTTANKYSLTGQDAVRQRFTGYQRDLETGLDFAEARYYNNSQGRFTAVDPLMASAKAANPQTMNRYGYALNNPYRMTDVSGMDVSGLDEQTDMAFQQLNELVDHAYEVKQAELDKAREEAEKKQKAQESVVQHGSQDQQTGPDNNQHGQAPQTATSAASVTPNLPIPSSGWFLDYIVGQPHKLKGALNTVVDSKFVVYRDGKRVSSPNITIAENVSHISLTTKSRVSGRRVNEDDNPLFNTMIKHPSSPERSIVNDKGTSLSDRQGFGPITDQETYDAWEKIDLRDVDTTTFILKVNGTEVGTRSITSSATVDSVKIVLSPFRPTQN